MTTRWTAQSQNASIHSSHAASWDGGVSVSKAAGQNTSVGLLPPHPESIPVNASSRLPMQCKLAVGAVNDPLEAEADRMASQVVSGGNAAGLATPASASALRREPVASSNAVSSVEAPPSVHQALHSAGQPLDPATRSTLETGFGRDLSRVRIHTGAQAAQSAADVAANAYTVGQNIFFAAGRYNPHSGDGRRLLAHELSHTIQQSGGAAAPSVQRDPTPQAADQDKKKKKPEVVTVPLPSDFANRFKLQPPSLLAPPQQPSIFSPGQYSLGGGSGSTISPAPHSLLPPPGLFPPVGAGAAGPVAPLGPTALPASPASGSSQAAGAGPKAPDRLSLHDFGRLSIGLRMGFPDLSKETAPGAPPSALQESLKKGEILNFMFTGAPPSEYSLDPGKLIGSVWGIFSTQIAPSVAQKIAAGMASKPSGSGPTFQLDATLLLNLGGPKTGGGAGATLSVVF